MHVGIRVLSELFEMGVERVDDFHLDGAQLVRLPRAERVEDGDAEVVVRDHGRDDGLAGSPSTGIDLSYIPAAERDSYLNSRDFADHLQTSTRKGRHPSALSQIGGVAEGMAINGAIMGLSGLTIGAQ